MGDQRKNIADERDSGAFRSLLLTFWPKVRAMLICQGDDSDIAEEIAQETMRTVWRKSHQFDGDKGRVCAWTYMIARNLRIARVRRHAVWQRDFEEFETIERLRTLASRPRSWEQHPGEIENALGRLPPEQMQVLQLSFVDGLSQGKIAARLNLPPDTVRFRMRLAFESLRSAAERGS